jgi:hypothetical protein
MPGDSQLNYEGDISRNAGIGLMNPMLNPSFEIYCSLMEALLTSVSGAKYFLSLSLKSEITVWT